MDNIHKKEVIRKWLEKNQFFNIETNDSAFMIADGISHRLVVIVASENDYDFTIEDIKTKTLQSGRQLWKADVEESEISWEIL